MSTPTADYECARCGTNHDKRAYGPGFAKVCPDCGSQDVHLTHEARERIGARTFKSESARDVQQRLVRGVDVDESYLDYLDEAAQANFDYYAKRGDMETAESMLTRSWMQALAGNDGD